MVEAELAYSAIAHRYICRLLEALGNQPLTMQRHVAHQRSQRFSMERKQMAYNLATAAAATGMHKTSVLNAINSGKISASLNAQNEWEIDPAELHRVYPQREDSSATQRYATAPRELMEALQRATVAETEVLLLRSIIEDLRRDWADLKQQAQQLAPEPALKLTWWQWLRSRS